MINLKVASGVKSVIPSVNSFEMASMIAFQVRSETTSEVLASKTTLEEVPLMAPHALVAYK